MAESTSRRGGIGFASALALLFIGLKLGRVIDWSWWYVLMPLWAPFGIVAAVMAILLLFLGICEVIDTLTATEEQRRTRAALKKLEALSAAINKQNRRDRSDR